jgi:signal transduction histidine kinase
MPRQRVARAVGLLAEPPPPEVLGLACGAAVVAGITTLLYPLRELDPGVSSGVLYVLGVLLVATYWGLGAGLVTSFASAAALDYFHATPDGDLLAVGAGDLAATGVLLVTAIVASFIADAARVRAQDAEERLSLEAELRERDAERIRLEEVRASRARMLAAADAERRRLVRDLHDGAQQRLVHATVTLKLAKQALELGEPTPEALLDEALEHTEAATAELRELVHGILPAVLAQGGLRAAVEALSRRMPLPVAVDVPPTRLPAEVEATAYFVVAEGLTNVVKHAHARSAAVSASILDHRLVVELSDDGVGGARRNGGGLVELEDRLAVHDGHLQVKSPPGRGTTLEASIPLPE